MINVFFILLRKMLFPKTKIMRIILYTLTLAIIFNITGIAQTRKTVSDSKQNLAANIQNENSANELIRESAASVLVEVGKEASNLTNASNKLILKIEVVEILQNIRKDDAIIILESAWQDLFDLPKESRNSNFLHQQKKIVDLASKISPEKAKKWQQFIKTEKEISEGKNNENKQSPKTSKQKADILLKAAIAKAEDNPQTAVSEALSALQITNSISNYYTELFQKLTADKQSALLEKLENGLADYAVVNLSSDISDLGTISHLLNSNLISNAENRRKLSYFLLNSTREVLNNQIIIRQTLDENFRVYEALQIFIRPVISRFSPSDLSIFDDLLLDISSSIPPEKLKNPIINPESFETQIENAKKIVGFKERDKRLIRIATWLLSSKIRSSREDIIDLAKSATDEISELESRNKLSDLIKILEIEKFINGKEFIYAEKKSDSISQTEWRAWTLMMLGRLQKEDQTTANDLYYKSYKLLLKSNPSIYKAQLLLDLASLQPENNKQMVLDIMTEIVKVLNQVEDTDSNKNSSKIRLSFYSSINGFEIDADALNDMRMEDLFFRPDLGKLAVSDWSEMLQISQRIKPISPRLNFQLFLAKNVLANQK